MYLRKAYAHELGMVYSLYQSVIGSEFCTWNAQYPGMEEINEDYRTGNLFVLMEGENMIGAASIVPQNEMDAFSVWTSTEGSEREVARVVIAKGAQGKGAAVTLVGAVMHVLEARGCAWVHLAVCESNLPARKTYAKLGFTSVGEEDMYGHHFYLLEKKLGPLTVRRSA